MSVRRRWVVCAIALAMVCVIAGNALATVVPEPTQQDQKPNNNWVIPVVILVGGIAIFVAWGFLYPAGM